MIPANEIIVTTVHLAGAMHSSEVQMKQRRSFTDVEMCLNISRIINVTIATLWHALEGTGTVWNYSRQSLASSSGRRSRRKNPRSAPGPWEACDTRRWPEKGQKRFNILHPCRRSLRLTLFEPWDYSPLGMHIHNAPHRQCDRNPDARARGGLIKHCRAYPCPPGTGLFSFPPTRMSFNFACKLEPHEAKEQHPTRPAGPSYFLQTTWSVIMSNFHTPPLLPPTLLTPSPSSSSQPSNRTTPQYVHDWDRPKSLGVRLYLGFLLRLHDLFSSRASPRRLTCCTKKRISAFPLFSAINII